MTHPRMTWAIRAARSMIQSLKPQHITAFVAHLTQTAMGQQMTAQNSSCAKNRMLRERARPASSPIGYYCIVKGIYYVASGVQLAGIDPSKIRHTSAGNEQQACSNYLSGDCPDQSCTPFYGYTCSKDGNMYAESSDCQNACGGAMQLRSRRLLRSQHRALHCAVHKPLSIKF